MIKILTNGRGEALVYPLNKFIGNNIKIEKLHDYEKSYTDYNSFRKISKAIKSNNFHIVHMNCRPDLFSFWKKENIIYIFESHWCIPGMDFKYGKKIIESAINKAIFIAFYPIFKLLYNYKIRKLDLYYVSIPWLLDLTWNTAKRLPNPVDLSYFYKRKNRFEVNKEYINIFYPNGLRKVKNCKFALDLMYKIQCKYKKVRFYMINSHWNQNKYQKELNLIKNNIVWLNTIPRDKMPNYYSADWDLLLWSFFPEKPYAMLNMIENEAMACKAPVLCCDLNEVIFEPLENLENLAYKIIEDKKYREWYITRNYEYIKKVHSCEAVAKIYEEDIKNLLQK